MFSLIPSLATRALNFDVLSLIGSFESQIHSLATRALNFEVAFKIDLLSVCLKDGKIFSLLIGLLKRWQDLLSFNLSVCFEDGNRDAT
jgi:hypothetical protein